jgi:hypothetical protein
MQEVQKCLYTFLENVPKNENDIKANLNCIKFDLTAHPIFYNEYVKGNPYVNIVFKTLEELGFTQEKLQEKCNDCFSQLASFEKDISNSIATLPKQNFEQKNDDLICLLNTANKNIEVAELLKKYIENSLNILTEQPKIEEEIANRLDALGKLKNELETINAKAKSKSNKIL